MRHETSDQMPAPGDAPLTDRVRMPLLTLITQQSLDEDYLHAAERRVASNRPPGPGGRLRAAVLVATVVAVFGVLISTAFTQTSRGADVAKADRQGLITRVDSRRDRVAQLQERSSTLTQRNARLVRRLSRSTAEEQRIVSKNTRLQVSTGLVAVTGDGIRVTVTQSPGAADDPNLAVHDSDLALLANALWSAGAEAISVNNQRLTAITGIRRGGLAILVNRIGIAPPYVVEAIGDQRTLAARFAESGSGQQFIGVAGQYGFGYTVQNVDRLSLAAAPFSVARVRQATIGTVGEEPGRRGDAEEDGP